MKYYNEKEYQLFITKLGLKVSHYRRLANMTQEELSEKVNMSLNFIAQLEAPSLKSLYKISSVLGVSINELVDVKNV